MLRARTKDDRPPQLVRISKSPAEDMARGIPEEKRKAGWPQKDLPVLIQVPGGLSPHDGASGAEAKAKLLIFQNTDGGLGGRASAPANVLFFKISSKREYRNNGVFQLKCGRKTSDSEPGRLGRDLAGGMRRSKKGLARFGKGG